MITIVSRKGSVVIPAELRKKYDLTPGKRVLFVDYGGVISLIPAMDDPIKQAAGMLRDNNDDASLAQILVAEHKKEVERE
jgi:AbrB family looped-hinge helix DNA binding protein